MRRKRGLSKQIQPPCLYVSLNLPIPKLGVVFVKPGAKLGQSVGG